MQKCTDVPDENLLYLDLSGLTVYFQHLTQNLETPEP